MTPRLRAESVGQRTRFLKKRDELIILERCCEVPTRRYSVLDGFTDNLLIQNQEKTLSRAAERFVSDCSVWELEKDKYSCVSSAYKWKPKPSLLIMLLMGVVYKVKSKGPRTEPCGTPRESVSLEEDSLPTRTDWERQVK